MSAGDLAPIAGLGVTLRPWTEEDLDAMVTLFDDPDIARWTPLASPFNASAARAYYERAASMAATRLQLAVTETGAGEPMGEVMLDIPTGVAGYMVGRAHRGRGLARRALSLITDHAHLAHGIAVVSLDIGVDNVASEAVAKSAGFVRLGPVRTVTNKGALVDVVRWRHEVGTQSTDWDA